MEPQTRNEFELKRNEVVFLLHPRYGLVLFVYMGEAIQYIAERRRKKNLFYFRYFCNV